MISSLPRTDNLSSLHGIFHARRPAGVNVSPQPAERAPGGNVIPAPPRGKKVLYAPADPVVDVGRAVQNARLSEIDGAVRAHEQAHLAALGPYATGGAEYSYLITADGRRYAVGGSVDVNLQPVPGDPEATIRKAKALIMAAYAPTSPSGPDMRVAAEAYRMEMEAKRQLAQEEQAKKEEKETSVNLYA
jgi:hypothetical protein